MKKRFGGMGGLMEGRLLNAEDDFEMTVNRVLGDLIRTSDDWAEKMWGALANVDWTHVNGDIASYSFRAAGDMIAAIRGKGNYMDWYCSSAEGVVDPVIAERMQLEGWSYET